MASYNCTDCGVSFESENEHRVPFCFKCKISSVRLGFRQGKDFFHGPTIREQQRQQEAAMTREGIAWEKLPEKAVW